MLLGSCLLAVPLLLYVAMVVGVHAAPVRSFGADARRAAQRRPAVSAGLSLLGLLLFAATPRTRQDLFEVGLLLLALLGARIMRTQLIGTFEHITRDYLDPDDWSPPSPPGARWRYEMKSAFVDDPEYVDALLMKLIDMCTSYEELAATIRAGRFPCRFQRVLERRYWGRIFPSVRQLAERVVLEQVMTNDGPHSAGKSAEEVFAELRALAQTDRVALMDRWQYYWCLRNLNVVRRILRLGYGGPAELGIVAGSLAVGTLLALVGAGASADAALRAELVGALAWVVVACGGASILLISLFRGTGTFAVSYPGRGTHYDPLWSTITRLGIMAFAICFVVYGIGSPFVLKPDALDHFRFDAGFVVLAALSLAFCSLMFVNHFVGTHMLMLGSRENALARAERSIADAASDAERSASIERFKEARSLGVWPIRDSSVAGLIGGIVFPIVAQVIVIYSGLNR